MSFDMRLFKRNGWYHVEVTRNKPKALNTKDEKQAKIIFREMEKALLDGKLQQFIDYKTITLGEFRKDYVKNFRSGLASHTTKHDERSLRLLSEVIGDDTMLAMISPVKKGNKKSKIEEFKTALTARKVKPVSINSYLRHIKKALNNAVDAGLLKDYARIKMMKVGKRLPKIMYPGQVDTFLANTKKEDIKEWLFYMICFWTGARRAEAASADWFRISLDRDEITLIGKGNHERTVSILPPLHDALEPFKKDIGPVFEKQHLDTYSHDFKKRIRAMGIEDIHLHNTRHTAATYMLKSGIDIKTVQKILGHASVTTTEIYIEVLNEVIKREMQKYEIK
jgi:site-specific recombinase XerD